MFVNTPTNKGKSIANVDTNNPVEKSPGRKKAHYPQRVELRAHQEVQLLEHCRVRKRPRRRQGQRELLHNRWLRRLLRRLLRNESTLTVLNRN